MDIGPSRPRPSLPALALLTDRLSEYAYPLMRIVTGLTLAPHACQKLFEWFGGSRAGIAAAYAKAGLDPAMQLVEIVGACELGAGLALALGLYTRLAALIGFVLLTVVWYKLHLVNGFFWTKLGIEYPLFWSLMMLGFVLGGGGKYSLDANIGKEI